MNRRLGPLLIPPGLAALLAGAVSAAPAAASTAPLTIDTASEGYPCSNGVCTFPSGAVSWSYAAPITSGGGSGPTPTPGAWSPGRFPLAYP